MDHSGTHLVIQEVADPGLAQVRRRRPISRVLSWAIIHLGRMSPCVSSNLPESHADHVIRFLFGLAPSGVYLAESVTRTRGALLPHHFTLTTLPLEV